MPLAPGTRLGSYEIAAAIGAGGMGEVYRARDTKLGRDVAIKVVLESLVGDADRAERFQREARALAALNHPNIATLYGLEEVDGQHFLVMELIEGPTLADRIAAGAIPLDEALPIARQIAEALEAAHEAGIIHRDLKPANVKVKPDGTVKVLDFGLAKAMDPVGESGPDAANSPTLTARATQMGTVLGTAAYMAPEQARGRTVDKRADIWAFGAVLFEMLTGRQMFTGESTTDVLAAVVRAEPDWGLLPESTPPSIRRLLTRCLKKDRKVRLPDIGVVRLDIDEAGAPDAGAVTERPGRPASGWVSLALALVFGAAVASGIWAVFARSSSPEPTPVHLSVELEPGAVGASYLANTFAISPDGQWITYLVVRGETRKLFLRGIGESQGRVIEGTDEAIGPFFSPDGRWIAFGAGETLKKVPVSGGAPVPLCKMAGNSLVGGDWGADGSIVFVPDFNLGIWTVSEDGGTAELLLGTDAERDRITYLHPKRLPEGRGVLFSMMSGEAKKADDFDIAVLEPGATEPRVMMPGFNAQYVPETGHIVYVQGGVLISAPFDLSSLVATATPTPMTEAIERGSWGYVNYALARSGTLVYEPSRSGGGVTRLAVVDPGGSVEPITDGSDIPAEFSISPDGEDVVARVIAANDDLWTYEVPGGRSLPLTLQPPDEVFPQWTPGGDRIVFGTRTGRIFSTLSNGADGREQLTEGEYGRAPSSFSPDGRLLAFVETHPSTQRDIWLLPVDGDGQAQPFLNTSADEWSPRFSPDGRWVVYVSDETGRAEVYVRAADATGPRRKVSRDGGDWPVWSRSWDVFFSRGKSIVSVRVDPDGAVAGPERVVVDAPTLDDLEVDWDQQYSFFDVMPDGKRLVVRFGTSSRAPSSYAVVLNWFEELRRGVPVR